MAESKKEPQTTTYHQSENPFRWFLGMILASCFSMVYFIAPFYILACIFVLIFRFPKREAILFATPFLLSAVLPAVVSPRILSCFRPMLDYFEFEKIHELSPIDVGVEMQERGTNYMCVCQPHGALSITGIVYSITQPEFVGVVPSAVADAVLYTPIIKHVMGIFGLISASKKSMQRHLKRPNGKGSVVLYVGGLAEMFLSSETEEILYLKNRKGFIKLALTEGVDILPIYLFGNTSVLSVWKTGFLAALSRKLQVSLTYIWGKYYLPIPRDLKLLYVSGQPLGMPKIDVPTQEDIDKWHTKYCQEVERLFNTYKERVPEYKHKTLQIV